MSWVGVITDAGSELLRQWVFSSLTLSIQYAYFGTGTVDETLLKEQTALVSRKQTASIVSYTTSGAGPKLKLRITAPTTAYTLNQIGVWAKLGSQYAVLFAIFQNTDGVAVPSSSTTPDYAYTFYALLGFANTGTLTVNVSTSALVTETDMTTAIATAVARKQPIITVSGLLKGDGAGGISAAVGGTDYGRIAVGSYVGTGTYGSSNPNSLTFDFVPQMVLIAEDGLIKQFMYVNGFWWMGSSQVYTHDTSSSICPVTLTDNTLSWYSYSDAGYQMNTSARTYKYVAIG